MVANIRSGSSPGGALYYKKEKVDKDEAEVLLWQKMLEPYDKCGRLDIDVCMESFMPYLEANRRTKNPVFHASLNPAPEDRLSNDELRQIAREYMERMGYGAQPCFVFLHEDIERRHIHIVSLRVGLDGRKLAHDFEARRSREILDALERRYGLRPAAEGDAKQTYDTLSKLDYTKSDLKRQLASLVRSTLHRYRCTSFGELRTLLEYFNVSIEECRGTAHGHEYAGILYGALDDDATPQGVPIKSSRIGRDVGHRTLERYYARSFFFLMIRRPPRSTLFPYTTLFLFLRAGAGCCPFPGGVPPSVGSGRDHGRAAPHRRRTYLRYDVHRSPCGCRGQRFAPGTGVRGKRSGGAFRRWPSRATDAGG